jgi:hypothetical protein
MATLGCIARARANGFRLLYTLDPPDRIGEIEPPARVFRLNPFSRDWRLSEVEEERLCCDQRDQQEGRRSLGHLATSVSLTGRGRTGVSGGCPGGQHLMDTQRCQNHGPVRLLVPLLEFNHGRALRLQCDDSPPLSTARDRGSPPSRSGATSHSTLRPATGTPRDPSCSRRSPVSPRDRSGWLGTPVR